MTVTTRSVAATERVAARFARDLSSGECVALHGPMGAGKTHFVRGLVAGLGGDPRIVSSPTFVLLNVYDTPRLKVFHLDAYRTSGADEFEAIGFAELLEQPRAVVVVEWAERAASLLPPKHVSVTIEPTGARARRITVGATG